MSDLQDEGFPLAIFHVARHLLSVPELRREIQAECCWLGSRFRGSGHPDSLARIVSSGHHIKLPGRRLAAGDVWSCDLAASIFFAGATRTTDRQKRCRQIPLVLAIAFCFCGVYFDQPLPRLFEAVLRTVPTTPKAYPA
jgi:hypothetical protein